MLSWQVDDSLSPQIASLNIDQLDSFFSSFSAFSFMLAVKSTCLRTGAVADAVIRLLSAPYAPLGMATWVPAAIFCGSSE